MSTLTVEHEFSRRHRVITFAQTDAPTIVNHLGRDRGKDTYARLSGGASATILGGLSLDAFVTTTLGRDEGQEIGANVGVRASSSRASGGVASGVDRWTVRGPGIGNPDLQRLSIQPSMASAALASASQACCRGWCTAQDPARLQSTDFLVRPVQVDVVMGLVHATIFKPYRSTNSRNPGPGIVSPPFRSGLMERREARPDERTADDCPLYGRAGTRMPGAAARSRGS